MIQTVLVTGGAGFIGSHLCEYLLGKGNKVICLDNLYTGRRENIDHLISDPNFTLIEHDIIAPFSWESGIIDQIFNLACPASPVHYQKDPIFTTKTCTVGVLNILELARKHQARILQASTSEIYGDPLYHPQKESYRGNVNPIGPRACYDEGKRIAETLFYDYQRKFNLEVRVARIFNTYGPRMDPLDGRVVSNFIVQTLKDQDITIYGDGEQTRSFCYVSDVVNGLYQLMWTEGFSGPVNLGNPLEKTILEIAQLIKNLSKSKSQMIFKPLPEDDPQRRCPDISLAKERLNWEPRVALEVGLKETIKYFQMIQGE